MYLACSNWNSAVRMQNYVTLANRTEKSTKESVAFKTSQVEFLMSRQRRKNTRISGFIADSTSWIRNPTDSGGDYVINAGSRTDSACSSGLRNPQIAR